MNKKGNSPYIIVGILVVIVLILGGYISFDLFTNKYDIQNIKADNENLGLGESTRIFFDVANKGDLTFLGKIELIANETCFYSTNEQPISEIQPNSKIRSSITLRTESQYGNRKDSCIGKPFEIKLKLKDASGKILDEDKITIWIMEN